MRPRTVRGVRLTTRNAPVAGWFSRENGAATASDLLARDRQAGLAYGVALAAPFRGGGNWCWPRRSRTRTP